jgi:hypothetical protein
LDVVGWVWLRIRWRLKYADEAIDAARNG